MQAVTTVGLDIAKSVFQVHGIDAVGNVIIRRQLKRRFVLASPDSPSANEFAPAFPHSAPIVRSAFTRLTS